AILRAPSAARSSRHVRRLASAIIAGSATTYWLAVKIALQGGAAATRPALRGFTSGVSVCAGELRSPQALQARFQSSAKQRLRRGAGRWHRGAQRDALVAEVGERHDVLACIEEGQRDGVAGLGQWQLWAERQARFEDVILPAHGHVIDRGAALGGLRDARDLPRQRH